MQLCIEKILYLMIWFIVLIAIWHFSLFVVIVGTLIHN